MGVDIYKTDESCIRVRRWFVPERGELRIYRIFSHFLSLFLDSFLFFCASETGFTSAPGTDPANLSFSQNLVASRTQKQFEGTPCEFGFCCFCIVPYTPKNNITCFSSARK
jgi:hypothetical protein